MAKEGSKQFEEAMKKLEEIVDLLEGEEVSLDDALKRYEEGIKLVRFCSKKLEEAEKKIEVLNRDEEGKVVPSYEGEKRPPDKNTYKNSKLKKVEEEQDNLLF